MVHTFRQVIALLAERFPDRVILDIDWSPNIGGSEAYGFLKNKLHANAAQDI